MMSKRKFVLRRTENWAGASNDELWRLYARQLGQCATCNRAMSVPVLDHIVTRSRGGRSHIGNMQFVCTFCNASKGAGHNARFRIGIKTGDVRVPCGRDRKESKIMKELRARLDALEARESR